MEVIAGILQVVGSLGLFLFGMKIMGDGLQNAAGPRLQGTIALMTGNRFTAFLTGLGVTSIIQSSSATTVFVVSFVNAGLLSLAQAIGVILGANIGTTVTAWIVSYFGFKMNIASLAIPAIAIGLPFMFMKSATRRNLGDIFIGFGVLFLGLMFLKDSVPDIKQHPGILQLIAQIQHIGPLAPVIFVLIGTVITVIVQSSSAAMAITLVMANNGWIDYPTAAALCLGENIGTTITAQLAAIGQNRNSRRAAMAHTMFNVTGVFWVLLIFPLFLQFIDWLVPGTINSPDDIPIHLSMFHTMFNTLNAFLFIWFVPAYARLIEQIVPDRSEDTGKVYKLKYVSASLQDTPEIAVLTVKSEISKMAGKVQDMYGHFTKNLEGGKKKDPSAGNIAIFTMEDYVDQMQVEISGYIAACQQDRPSGGTSQNLSHMLKTVDDLENIADSTARLAGLLQRARDKKINFPEDHLKEMAPFLVEVGQALSFVSSTVCKPLSDEDFARVSALEEQIDTYRDTLKKAARKRIQSGSDVRMEILWIDMLEELEKIGDYVLEIGRELRALN